MSLTQLPRRSSDVDEVRGPLLLEGLQRASSIKNVLSSKRMIPSVFAYS
jgi:hypothetical protein